MAETKLSKAKVPMMKPPHKVKRLGLRTKTKRRMVSFRMKHETLDVLEKLTKVGRKYFHAKFSYSDTIEMCLSIWKDMEKATIVENGIKYLTERDQKVLTE